MRYFVIELCDNHNIHRAEEVVMLDNVDNVENDVLIDAELVPYVESIAEELELDDDDYMWYWEEIDENEVEMYE